MIVAAAAGLAAAAVVVVQMAVEDAGGEVAGQRPRLAAAAGSASAVEQEARLSSADDFQTWADWESHHRSQCALIAVVFGDSQVEVVANSFKRADGGTVFDTLAAGYAANADESAPTPVKAQAQCDIR